MQTIFTCGSSGQRTKFTYEGNIDNGVTLKFASGDIEISRDVFREAINQFRGKNIKGGFSMTNPIPGGFGFWVQNKSKELNNTSLTPRHGSFVAAILREEGYIQCTLDGNAVILKFNALRSAPMKRIRKDREFSLRAKSLGALGELIAIKALVDNDFERIRNLNDQKRNYPYVDLLAEKDGRRYVISVKSRNKYQRNGKLNNRYKLGNNCHATAKTAEERYKGEAFWLAIQFDSDRYSAYLGSLAQLKGKKGIPMNDSDLANYQRLACNQSHGIDFRPYLNTYREDGPNKTL